MDKLTSVTRITTTMIRKNAFYLRLFLFSTLSSEFSLNGEKCSQLRARATNIIPAKTKPKGSDYYDISLAHFLVNRLYFSRSPFQSTWLMGQAYRGLRGLQMISRTSKASKKFTELARATGHPCKNRERADTRRDEASIR